MKPPVVAFVNCADYETALASALDELLGHLGGWSALVKPGQKVLVKPNLLSDALPDQAITTHPELVRQVVRGLKKIGAVVQVGDSPAGPMNLAQVWRKTGMAAVCAAEQVPLLAFEQGGTRQVSRDGFTFAIADAVMDADLIVSLPKVKTHALTTLTAAVKNFYGVLPGYQKAQLHKAYPKARNFSRLLRAIHDVMPPSLSIADGVVGMEGEGPSNGRPVPLSFLAASTDAVALDLAICQALRIDPRRVPYLEVCATAAPSVLFELRGTMPEIRSFDVPSGSGHLLQLLPDALLRLVAPFVWVRPAFNNQCIFCGRCAAACPTQALRLEPKKRPLLNQRACIACCCCHEVCPAHAIRMRRSLLLRLAGVFRELK